jgi:hypothetical protein
MKQRKSPVRTYASNFWLQIGKVFIHKDKIVAVEWDEDEQRLYVRAGRVIYGVERRDERRVLRELSFNE